MLTLKFKNLQSTLMKFQKLAMLTPTSIWPSNWMVSVPRADHVTFNPFPSSFALNYGWIGSPMTTTMFRFAGIILFYCFG
jgi:hypothetical protein